jgi:tetratricopeptide (TPR) repeat protein
VLLYSAAMFAAVTTLSASRGGIVSLLVGLGVFALVSGVLIVGNLRSGRTFALVGAVAAVVTVGAISSALLASNWSSLARMEYILTPGVRGHLASHAFRLLQQNPGLGADPGVFLYAARAFRTQDQEFEAIFAHNDWLQYFAEYGWVGITALLFFLVVLARQALKNSTRLIADAVESRGKPLSTRAGLTIGALSASAACLAHSVTDFNLHVPANGLLVAILMGCLAGVGNCQVGAGWRVVGKRFLEVGLLLAVAVGGSLYLWVHSPTDYFRLASENAMFRGEAEKAISLGERGLELRPNDADLLAQLGQAYFGYESMLQFRRGDEGDLLIDDDGGAEAWSSFLSEKEQQSYLEKAGSFSLSAVAVRPREVTYLKQASKILADLDRPQEAAQLARGAIRLDPNHAFSWENYGDLLLVEDREREALRVFEVGAVTNLGDSSVMEAEFLREELGVGAEGP